MRNHWQDVMPQGTVNWTMSRLQSYYKCRLTKIEFDPHRLALLSYLKQQLSQYEIPLVGIRCNILNGDSSTSRKQCLLDLFGANGVSNDRIFALFTDDFYHPLHFHICSEISKIRNIPILAFDSNQVVVNNGMENCNHFDDFCLKYTACVEAMASLEWESEFTFERDEMLRVQRRLQFCRMGNSFLPSVLRFDDRERHFIDWDAIDRGLMLHVKDWPLNSITVEGHQRIRESVSVSNSSLTSETLDIMTVSSTFGLLSPLLWCKAYLANRQELQSVCNTFVYHEFAILSFVKEIHKIIVVKPTSGVIQVDWFVAFNDHVHSLLADSSGMLAMFQQKMRSVYGLVTPKDFRLCKSPIKSFNIVQKKLFDTKFHFNLSCIELQCWVLGYIGFLPTVNMALELSFRELLVHFPIGLEDSPLPAALFIRIIEDIMEPIRNIDDASQAMAVFTKRYEELQNEVELSQGT